MSSFGTLNITCTATVTNAAASLPSVKQNASLYGYTVPYTISLAANPTSGDLLFVTEHFRAGQTAAVTGFTLFKNIALTRGQLSIYTKTAAGTEQNASVTGSNIIGSQYVETSAASINAAVTHTANAVAMTVNGSTHSGTGSVTPKSTAPNGTSIPFILLTGADQGSILRVGTAGNITVTNGWNVTCTSGTSQQGDYSTILLSRSDNTNPPFTLTIDDTSPTSLDMTEFWVG